MRSPESQNPVVDVVAGLLVHEDKILVAQRKAGDSNGSFWEFPGGKVEPEESLDQALKREIFEELGMSIQVLKKIDAREMKTPRGVLICLHLLVASAHSQDFALHEHEQARWVQVSELNEIAFLPGNREFFPAILQWWSQRQ